MPLISIKVAGTALGADQSAQLQDGVVDLMVDLLGKQRDRIAVFLDHDAKASARVGGRPAALAAHVDVTIGAGTNTPAEKTAFIKAVYDLFAGQLGPSLSPVTFVVLHDVPLDSWGYEGVTNASRYAPAALFTPATLGRLTTAHRIVMAPLTRMRAADGDVPSELMATYYEQRASEGGLIISEATVISPTGRGYLGAPGIFTDEQVAGWKKVLARVHAKGGKMFLQLWHVGRQSHRELQPGNVSPVAPSAVDYDGVAFTSQGWVAVTPARALETGEIAAIVEDYRHAAERALAAGFDGVEIHAANGYLIDQFLQDGANKRTDRYGGSVENRTRFLLEVADAVISVWGADRVAVRLTPSGTFAGMSDTDPEATFAYVAAQLDPLGLAYLHIVEPRVIGSEADQSKDQHVVAAKQLRQIFKGSIVAAGGFDAQSAEAILAAGDADLVAFGRDFIANPDLPARIKAKAALTPYDRDTFYGGAAKGYTDYPFLA